MKLARLPVYFRGVRGYAVTVVAAAALLGLLVARPENPEALAEARALSEALVPVPLLLVSGGLLQADPSLRLIATKAVRLDHLLFTRYVAAFALTLPVPLALHLALAITSPGAHLPVLTWLAPTLFLSGLSVAVAAVTTSHWAGLGAAGAYWAFSLLTLPSLQEACSVAGACSARLWSTAFTFLSPGGPAWVSNRVVLLVAAAVLAAVTAFAYRLVGRDLYGDEPPEAT